MQYVKVLVVLAVDKLPNRRLLHLAYAHLLVHHIGLVDEIRLGGRIHIGVISAADFGALSFHFERRCHFRLDVVDRVVVGLLLASVCNLSAGRDEVDRSSRNRALVQKPAVRLRWIHQMTRLGSVLVLVYEPKRLVYVVRAAVQRRAPMQLLHDVVRRRVHAVIRPHAVVEVNGFNIQVLQVHRR